MPKPSSILKFLRHTHLYLGVFLSPAILFFAFTGALQTFSLHETTRGSDYKPPAWIATLSQLHKKQNTTPRKPKPDAPKADKPDRPATGSTDTPKTDKTPSPSTPPPPQKSHLPMKIFFLLVSFGLFTSTLTGIYMAYSYHRSKLIVSALLIAGIIVPLLLLPF
jgi:hypothetical protein